MDFDELLMRISEFLRARGRVSYAALARQFELNPDDLQAVRDELIDARRVATDENDRVIVWQTAATRIAGTHADAKSALPSAPASAPAERRRLTVLFCDLVDSTALSARLDPEILHEVLRAYQDAAGGVIERFGGHIAQYLGDGLLVYFGWPLAHENDAERAVRAGLGIVTAIGELAPKVLLKQGTRLEVRIGIHSGLAVVGDIGTEQRHERLALGETPNLAARLQGLAQPGAVLVSQATWRLLEDRFLSEDLGEVALRGISAPVVVHRIVGESGIRSRFDIAARSTVLGLVGRKQELQLLNGAWERSRGGAGQVVLISGEAGIGKSRLVQALKEQISEQGFPWGVLRCSPYFQNTALYPVIELWQQALGWAAAQDDNERLVMLETQLEGLEFDLAEALPLSAEMHGLDPAATRFGTLPYSAAQKRQRRIDLVLEMIHSFARRQPYLLVVEDLHWVDSTTAALLEQLACQPERLPLLAVYTSRPDIPQRCAENGVTRMQLAGLSETEVAEMISAIAGAELPPKLLQEIVQRADGIPAFVEELTRSFLESDALIWRDGRVLLEGQALPKNIPESLQDSLTARLDRLGKSRGVAQSAAVIGRWFDEELLRAIVDVPAAELDDALAELLAAELLIRHEGLSGVRYSFRYALIQETAYETLLLSRRKDLHRRVALVVEQRFPELQRSRPELLGHHYAAAGETADAIRWWRLAGQRALGRLACEDAIEHFSAALALVPELKDSGQRVRQERDLQLALGSALVFCRGWGAAETGAAFARALALDSDASEPEQDVAVRIGLFAHHLVRVEVHAAAGQARALALLADRDGRLETRLSALICGGCAAMYTGEPERAKMQFLRTLDLAAERSQSITVVLPGQDLGVTAHSWLGMSYWLLGQPAAADEALRTAVAQARSKSNPFSLVTALAWSTRVHLLSGRLAEAQRACDELNRAAGNHDIAMYAALGQVLDALLLARRQPGEEALASVRNGRDAWRATDAGWNAWLAAHFVEACLACGATAAALEAADAALAAATHSGETWWNAELLGLRAEALLARGEASDAALTALEQARESAIAASATALELRAELRLATQTADETRAEAARQRLPALIKRFDDAIGADADRARQLLQR